MDGLVGVPAIDVVSELHNHGLCHWEMVTEPQPSDKAPGAGGASDADAAESEPPAEWARLPEKRPKLESGTEYEFGVPPTRRI